MILVNIGVKRADLIARWKPINYQWPDSAVAWAGVPAEAVTDIIISHIHCDHFDRADPFSACAHLNPARGSRSPHRLRGDGPRSRDRRTRCRHAHQPAHQ